MAEWREVPGFGGNFLASSEGKVAKVYGYDYAKGYSFVNVLPSMGSNDALIGKVTAQPRSGWNLPIHRVIAITFLGDPPEGKPHINHKDGNKKNNRPSNLEWCSCAENLEHARRTGLQTDPLRKYTERQYKEARALRESGLTYREIASQMGIPKGSVVYAVYSSNRGRSEHRPWREAE